MQVEPSIYESLSFVEILLRLEIDDDVQSGCRAEVGNVVGVPIIHEPHSSVSRHVQRFYRSVFFYVAEM